MSTVAYPTEFPEDSIGYVVNVFRKVEPIDKAKIGIYGWNVQGYLQKLLLGEPEVQAVHSGPMHIEAETLAIALESLGPGKPQAILGGGLTKKLLLTAVIKLIEMALGTDFPASLEELVKGLVGSIGSDA